VARIDGFYLPPEKWREPFVLEGGEARHLLTVLRAAPGAQVRLFDGMGRDGLFVVTKADKRRAVLTPVELRHAPKAAKGMTLAVGFSKASRRDWLLEKAVELGAESVLFWQARRSQGRVPDAPKPGWTDTLVAAAKQCGASWLPALSVLPGGVQDLAGLGASFASRVLLWENEEDAVLTQADLSGRTLAVIGPEGGFEDEEAQTLRAAGFASRHLGSTTLRLETAALLVLGLHYHARTLATG